MPCSPEREKLRQMVQAFARALSSLEREQTQCYGLTPQQAYTLDLVSASPGVTMRALSERLGVATSTVTRNIEKLEAEGTVLRVRTSDDARSVQVVLTEQGAARLAQVHECYESYFGDILELIPPEEREIVLRGLTILHRAVQACCPS
jgi:DNA-binding MarR family transcriptional regulator